MTEGKLRPRNLSSFGWDRRRTSFEESAQPGLVKIAHRRLAACLDPFGMLSSQVLMNLLLKLGHGVDRVADCDCFECSPPRDVHNVLDKQPGGIVHWKLRLEAQGSPLAAASL